MDGSPTVKRDWVLTGEAFTKLLASLDADPDRAGEKYEAAHRMLVKFFHWRGAMAPEELSDETLNRVTRKIDEGDEIRDFTNYCYAVARLVFLESLKRPESREEPFEDLDIPAPNPEYDQNEDRQYQCFDDCLGTLPPESREVILLYYHDQRRAKIDHRKGLAERLGIPLNALRCRAQRTRDRLEKCVSQCVGKNS